MIHERLQRDIISEDSLRRYASTVTSCRMCSRGVQLGQEETRLRSAGVTDDETRQWEAVSDQFLFMQLASASYYNCSGWTNPSVLLRLLQESLQVFITFLFLIACFPPFCNGLSVED